MKFIELLANWTMETPRLYGIFHIFFLLVMVITTILLVHHFRDSSERVMKRIVLISWIVLVVFEILKQLVYSYSDGVLTYSWARLPFQFCETPLYVMPLLLFTKNQKIKNASISFLSTYALFAGLAIMICPLTVMSSLVLISIRTMIQHGLQVVIGVYLYAWNRKNTTIEGFLYGTVIFVISVLIAIFINEIFGRLIVKQDINMFFIAKNLDSEILIVKDIKPYVPWIIFLLAYTLGFIVLAFGTHLFETKVYELWMKKHAPVEEKEFEFKN